MRIVDFYGKALEAFEFSVQCKFAIYGVILRNFEKFITFICIITYIMDS